MNNTFFLFPQASEPNMVDPVDAVEGSELINKFIREN